MCKRLDISFQTAFDWRHKLLLNLTVKKIIFSDEIDLNNISFNFSVKGRKNAKIIPEKYNLKTTKDIFKITNLFKENKSILKILRVGLSINSHGIYRKVNDLIKKVLL